MEGYTYMLLSEQFLSQKTPKLHFYKKNCKKSYYLSFFVNSLKKNIFLHNIFFVNNLKSILWPTIVLVPLLVYYSLTKLCKCHLSRCNALCIYLFLVDNKACQFKTNKKTLTLSWKPRWGVCSQDLNPASADQLIVACNLGLISSNRWKLRT